MLDLVLLVSGPAFLAGAVALALLVDRAEARRAAAALAGPRRSLPPRPRLRLVRSDP